MASKNKYKADTSWSDIIAYLRDLEVKHGLEIELRFPTIARGATLVAIEVLFFDFHDRELVGRKPLVRHRGSFPARGEGQLNAVLYTCTGAWAAYVDEPWQWSYKDRRLELVGAAPGTKD